ALHKSLVLAARKQGFALTPVLVDYAGSDSEPWTAEPDVKAFTLRQRLKPKRAENHAHRDATEYECRIWIAGDAARFAASYTVSM
ncbi:MAG: hypothetical protein RL701_1722, partial [Pseudomonadota bacterium]